jgi:hypothetical protein
MKHVVIAVCVTCAVVAAAAGLVWNARQGEEVSALDYASIYALRRMEPDLFREKLLPDLEKALADGRLTYGEWRALEKRAAYSGETLLQAVKARSLEEELGRTLRDAGKKAEESGRNLGESLGRALDQALDFLFRGEEGQGGNPAPEEPKTF